MLVTLQVCCINVFGLDCGSKVSFEQTTLNEVEAFLGQEPKTRNAIWFSKRAHINILDRIAADMKAKR